MNQTGCKESAMRKPSCAGRLILSGSLITLTLIVNAAEQTAKTDKMPTDQEIIASAMKAAPPKVAQNATIVAINPDGTMRTVRKGTNNFTCMGDNPETPGPDPMCMDKNAMDWVHAWIGKKNPTAGKVGFMYMLAGGTDASNTDPY